MKTTILSVLIMLTFFSAGVAQNNIGQQLASAVARLQTAEKPKDYIQLAGEFEKIASNSNNWLSHYYAAFCNAKIGWLYQNDGERIEPFADKAEQHAKAALSLLDTLNQKKELSELYCVESMLNRARVFVNPMTQGTIYGPAAFIYLQRAVAANPGNPRASYLSGWEKYYTPKMYGGDKKKAKELLQQAKTQLSAEKPVSNYPHWGEREIEELLAKMK